MLFARTDSARVSVLFVSTDTPALLFVSTDTLALLFVSTERGCKYGLWVLAERVSIACEY